MIDDDDNNVVPLRPGTVTPGEAPEPIATLGGVSFEERRKSYRVVQDEPVCLHPRRWLDEDTRSIVCQICDRQLDMYATVLTWTREWNRKVRANQWLDGEIARKESALAVLEAEERRCKDRLRRVQGELPLEPGAIVPPRKRGKLAGT